MFGFMPTSKKYKLYLNELSDPDKTVYQTAVLMSSIGTTETTLNRMVKRCTPSPGLWSSLSMVTPATLLTATLIHIQTYSITCVRSSQTLSVQLTVSCGCSVVVWREMRCMC